MSHRALRRLRLLLVWLALVGGFAPPTLLVRCELRDAITLSLRAPARQVDAPGLPSAHQSHQALPCPDLVRCPPPEPAERLPVRRLFIEHRALLL